jgi:hypothetical protein
MTDAEFELELVEALNMLLEDERASVEMEVALASGATEYGERETLAGMGAEDIRFCVQLREEMEQAGLPVTPQINGVVFEVVGSERYDDRLRAFGHHQRVVADRARELQQSNLEGGLREALDGISISHDLHAAWVERYAADFAATRTLEFGVGARARTAAAEEAAAGAETAVPGGIEEREEPGATIETIETITPEAPDAGVAPETPSAEESLTVVEVPVVEPEEAPEEPAAPAPKESAAPTKPRATTRTTTRSTAAKGGAKSGATRAKATPKKPSTTTPKPRTRRSAATPETPPNQA